MKSLPLLASLVLATAVPSLSACGGNSQPATAGQPEKTQSAISAAMQKASDEVRHELATGNIDLSADEGRPKGEITPAGDLLVDGKQVEITSAQRALLLQYRGQIAEVAQAGMEIGMQGAKLATKAMGEAFAGVLRGDTKDMEQRIEAEAEKIAAQAVVLCGKLPAMLATERQLAASLPEFAPYARMTQKDIDDCHEDSDHDAGPTPAE